MTRDTAAENERAIWAAQSTENLNQFLMEEEQHILRLTGKVLKREVTKSDDEWWVALMAVSEAVKKYDGSRGDFWSYAAFLIKSRETDLYRSGASRQKAEIAVAPELFGNDPMEDGLDYSLQKDINDKTAYAVDNSLKEEIEELTQVLDGFGIDFFDLAECSPKAEKTKDGCARVVRAIFTPPPLLQEILRSKNLPAKKIMEREKVSAKLLERHRKYLLSVVLILSGDYPLIADFIPFKI